VAALGPQLDADGQERHPGQEQPSADGWLGGQNARELNGSFEGLF
jgi:hypothetical protein